MWQDDPGHYLVKLGEGLYSEYETESNTWTDYEVAYVSTDDSILILANKEKKDKTDYVKVTDLMIYFSDSFDGLVTTDRAYAGKWDQEDEECNRPSIDQELN